MTALINGIDFDNMTREQAVATVGAETVKSVEIENCDFTNGVRDDGWVEFAASVKAVDADGNECELAAYYYQDEDAVKECESLDQLDWKIDHYRIW